MAVDSAGQPTITPVRSRSKLWAKLKANLNFGRPIRATRQMPSAASSSSSGSDDSHNEVPQFVYTPLSPYPIPVQLRVPSVLTGERSSLVFSRDGSSLPTSGTTSRPASVSSVSSLEDALAFEQLSNELDDWVRRIASAGSGRKLLTINKSDANIRAATPASLDNSPKVAVLQGVAPSIVVEEVQSGNHIVSRLDSRKKVSNINNTAATFFIAESDDNVDSDNDSTISQRPLPGNLLDVPVNPLLRDIFSVLAPPAPQTLNKSKPNNPTVEFYVGVESNEESGTISPSPPATFSNEFETFLRDGNKPKSVLRNRKNNGNVATETLSITGYNVDAEDAIIATASGYSSSDDEDYTESGYDTHDYDAGLSPDDSSDDRGHGLLMQWTSYSTLPVYMPRNARHSGLSSLTTESTFSQLDQSQDSADRLYRRVEIMLSCFTLYEPLQLAYMMQDDEERKEAFRSMFIRMQAEWTVAAGLLVGMMAVDVAVFATPSPGPDIAFKIDHVAHAAVLASSIASALGLTCTTWFLIRYNWADLDTFILRARDLFSTYMFFAISARIPILLVTTSVLSLLLFLGRVVYVAWPKSTLVFGTLIATGMTLQYWIYAIVHCIQVVRKLAKICRRLVVEKIGTVGQISRVRVLQSKRTATGCAAHSTAETELVERIVIETGTNSDDSELGSEQACLRSGEPDNLGERLGTR